MIRLLAFVALMWMSHQCVAQCTQTARYERDHKSSDNEFIIISMFENGLALVRDKDKFKDGKKLWEVIRLDTELTETWALDLSTENRLRLVGYDYRDNLIYLLFREGDHEASNLVLHTVHIQTQQTNRYTIKQEISFKVTHFSALANVITLGGYVSSEPAILLFDLETEKAKLVPGFFVTNSELLDLRVNTNNTFNALIMDRSNKQNKKLLLKTFDATGAALLEDEIEIDPARTILTAITSSLLNDELLIAGTWTVGNAKQAGGIFTTLADPFSQQPVQYYPFGQFEHFLDYTPPKRAARIRAKSNEAISAQKIPDFKTYALPMRIAEQPHGYALLVEVYQPAANLGPYPYPYYGTYGPPMYGSYPYGYNPFMNRYYSTPYQYNQPQQGDSRMILASVAVFDQKAKLVKDYGLKLDELKTSTVEQTADFSYENNEVILGFKKEKVIKMLRSQNEDLKPDTVTTRLSKTTETIRNENERNTYLRSWYGTTFYAWGYHSLRDISQGVLESGRQIFYINKIECR
ncbi:MAG: hypothetical protein J0L66_10145 [Cytophagales bacterium]|nr:hypothetical protein [Cytophagales bacterium]